MSNEVEVRKSKMNDEQTLRISSIKTLSVELLTAAHDMSEGRLISVMAELSELFRVVRMDHDTRHSDDAPFEPKPTVARSSDELKDLAEAEFMMQVGLSEDVRYEHDKVWPIPPEAYWKPVPPEAFGLENPPVSDEPTDVAPRVFDIADDDDDDEAGTTDVDADLKMSAMYDATTKWV